MTAEPGTRVLKAEPAAIAAAAACLAAGGLVAFPTETVYGLGADAGNGEAVARLYAAKGRPHFNPLIAHVGSIEAARRLGRFDAAAETLAAAFWPGPLTLVLPKRPDAGVADLALAGLDSVAVRVPAHPVARALLAAFDGPVVAPSANRSGHVSPTDAAHVLADLRGRIDMVLDGGPCPVGLESTIVACLGAPTLLRPGGLPREAIERVLGRCAGRGESRRRRAARAWHARLALCAQGQPAARRRRRPSPARRCSPSGRRRTADAQSVAARRPDRGGGQSVFAFARAGCFRRQAHRGNEGAARGPGRGHQRPAQARRGAENGDSMNLHSKPQPMRALAPDLLARFVGIVGEKYAITDKAAQQSYLVEMRDLFHGQTPVVLRPGSVEEVAAILKLANETKTAIVPQGGNTGLVGGQIPQHGEVVLSLTRLDKIREVDAVSNTMTVEAGVTLQRAREAAAEADRLYPQLLPSEGTCTIGGNLSTNAGGTAAIAHGIARSHALGLEVVLADGRVLRDLNKLKKDNTGYDLKNLFIGSEGTLGIITAAVLRLVPRPRSVETAFAGVPSPQAAVDLLNLATDRTAAASPRSN